MTPEGGISPPDPDCSEADAVLKAKYLDYCSAQVADILLLLSPDEMFVLAQDAAKEAGLSGDLDYEQIVDLATGRVSKKLGLPPFEVWVEDYKADPGRYDEYLMGLWRSELTAEENGESG